MEKITSLSEKIYSKIHAKDGREEVVFDPATMMLILSILSSIFKAWQECKKEKEQALQVAHSPSEREKRVLRRKIRRGLGRQKYQEEGDLYYEAVLSQGKDAVLQDIVDGYRETTVQSD